MEPGEEIPDSVPCGEGSELALSGSLRIFDARGSEVKEGLQAKGLPTGTTAIFTTLTKEGVVEVQTIRLMTYFLPRPDSFYLDHEKAGFHIQGEYEGSGGARWTTSGGSG